MSNAVLEHDFKLAMRNLAAGVTLITSLSHDNQPGGMTATAVCSLSASPAQLLVCVNRNASTHALISASGRFCVNVLADRHRAVAAAFSGGLPWQERFQQGSWSTLATGAPVLQDALAAFDCELAETFVSNTHSIFVGRVLAVRHEEREAPLMYFRSQYTHISHPADTPQSAA